MRKRRNVAEFHGPPATFVRAEQTSFGARTSGSKGFIILLTGPVRIFNVNLMENCGGTKGRKCEGIEDRKKREKKSRGRIAWVREFL